MKILHLNDHLASVGGVETYLLGLIPRLESQGCDVHVGFATGDPSVVRQAHHLPLLSSIRQGDIAEGRRQVEALIGQLQPDVIHLHGIQNLGAIQAAVHTGNAVLHTHDFRPICPASNFFYKRTQQVCQRVSGVGCYGVTLAKHCMTPRPAPATYFLNRVRWVKANANRFLGVIAPSEAAKQRFVQAGFSSAKITTNPYFCPLVPANEPRPLPKNSTITFLGRASYNKGWETFIAALGLLPDSVSGLMIGGFSDTQRDNIRQLASKAGCEDRLAVEGWAGRDAIANIMGRTTVLVFPSLWPETLGIVGLEALSQGVPVVASDIGGVREWLVPGETGLLAEPGNAASFSSALTELLGNAEKNRKMGEDGIRLINKKFSPDIHLEKLLSVYNTVANTIAYA